MIRRSLSSNGDGDDAPCPKRLRGGGADEFDEYDDPAFEDEEEEEEEEVGGPEIPDEFETAEATVEDDAAADVRYARPAVPSSFSSSTSDLSLQWLDIDVSSGAPLRENPRAGKKVVGSLEGTVPVVRMFGVTAEGLSVCVRVHGFTAYGYFAVPDGYRVDDGRMSEIRRTIDRRLSTERKGQRQQQQSPCVGVSLVKDRSSIMGYESSHKLFLKIYVDGPSTVPTLKRVMEDGIELPGITDASGDTDALSYQPFECNVPFVLRFMIDRGITGAGWITLPKNTYRLRDEHERTTRCRLEADVVYDEILPDDRSAIAKLRVLSMDIECQGRKGHFPEADQDPVIQIANLVYVYGEDRPIAKTVFTLGGCSPIVGAEVVPCRTEEELLLKWKDFLRVADPDVVTGYNVQNFDIPYLLDRCDALEKKNKKLKNNVDLSPFRYWGRVLRSPVRTRQQTFQSAAYGKRNNTETTIDGRVVFDMLPYTQRNHKLSSYTLNSVCTEFLGRQKEDVHHSIIADLQNGDDQTRRRLASYCLTDAELPYALMTRLNVLVNYVEMARVTGVPLDFLATRGQQIKVFSMILRKCRAEKLLVPTLRKGGVNADDAGYEGATVLDPIKAYYRDPVATLDFASLYPSIMQAYNLCYSTLVAPRDASRLDPDSYHKSDNGNVFVKATVKKGVLPTILEELLSARKRAKRDMKNAPTEFEKAVQNGRQLALKVSANSVYGFTGAGVGQLPCLPIASSVTSYGRILLERTKKFVEETYTVANGYKHNARVVYGDTDSVMVEFGTSTVADTFPLAEEAADKCTEIFPRPIKLEFEKVYCPYLLMNKKRYAGLMWTNVDHYDKMDTKGLETVRRDNCALVREVIQTSLDRIIVHKDVPGAIAYVKSQISDLLQNRMDISRLVITKSLNKGADYALGLGGKPEDYKVKQAHVELAARMRKRDPGSAPQTGDRVPYVMITGPKGAANFEKSEDPVYVLENRLTLDSRWYLTNQLSKPLTRIFEPIVENVERELLHGEHTRTVCIPTPAAKKGNLMMFASKGRQCMGCRVRLNDRNSVKGGNTDLCRYCAPREAQIYLEKLAVLREAETRHAVLWAAVQRVHGTVHSEVMCTGDGCSCQFYRRKKAQQDVRAAQEVVDKFGY